MSNIARMMQRATAGAGVETLDVDEVFSTFLYEGTGSVQGVLNNIDLSGEGGLVWGKCRNNVNYPYLFDTERGVGKVLYSNATNAESDTGSNYVYTFKNNGFNIGTGLSVSGQNHVTWTFRKAPKFFDVITYSGNSTAGRTISHNLGCTVGQVWVKRTNTTNNWICWHRGIANNQYLSLNSTNQAYSDGGIFWNNTTPSSTTVTLGADSAVNATGSTYVMYVFAHNNNDGGFGPDGDKDIIKCGTYTGNGTSTGPVVNLGFEPQWLLIKNADGSNEWTLFDSMRGLGVPFLNVGYYDLNPNNANAEAEGRALGATSTGFQALDNHQEVNGNGFKYIYMAIRRGPLAVPEDATKVFSVNTTSGGDNKYSLGFVPDLNIHTRTSGDTRYLLTRLLGQRNLQANNTNTLSSLNTNLKYWNAPTNTLDLNTSWWGNITNLVSWSWKRAPGYFDITTWEGTGSALNINHNLGVAPEMIWVKTRDTTYNWTVFHSALGNNKGLYLNSYSPSFTNTATWNNTAPTSTVFSVNNDGYTNKSGDDFVAYLFATVSGISKVGSYTGNGTNQNIECGFSSGARFVLTKNTSNSVGNWSVWDTARGLTTSPNSYWLRINGTNAHNNSYDWLEPYSGGFKVLYGGNANSPNNNGENYIFYAIA